MLVMTGCLKHKNLRKICLQLKKFRFIIYTLLLKLFITCIPNSNDFSDKSTMLQLQQLIVLNLNIVVYFRELCVYIIMLMLKRHKREL